MTTSPVEIPNFYGELLPFQVEDVAKLISVPSSLNCNEMGCGKTIEAIAMDTIYRNYDHGPTLIIAPLAAIDDAWERWLYELTKFEFTIINTKNREASWNDFTSGNKDIFVTHWQSLLKMPELASYKWMHVIADEAHYIQNPRKYVKLWEEDSYGIKRCVGRRDTTTGCFKRINAPRKLAMSGTPMDASADKLFSVLNWLYPKVYSAKGKFFEKYVEYVTDEYGYRHITGTRKDRLPQLHQELDKFFVRHRKIDIAPELPEKYYSVLTPELTTPQQKMYDSMKKQMLTWVGKNEDQLLTASVPVAQFTRLHQISNATIVLDDQDNVTLVEPSNKINCLVDDVLKVVTGQVIVFSAGTKMLDLTENRLRKEGISVARVDGTVSRMARQGAIERFQAGRARVFLGTIAAAGEGITLTAASTVVFLDETDRPTLNAQAEDRAWRIGQKNAVHVIHIRSRKTVDQKREKRLIRKAQWIRETLGD